MKGHWWMGVFTPHLEDQWAIRWWMDGFCVINWLEVFGWSLEEIGGGLGEKGAETEKLQKCNWDWNPSVLGRPRPLSVDRQHCSFRKIESQLIPAVFPWHARGLARQYSRSTEASLGRPRTLENWIFQLPVSLFPADCVPVVWVDWGSPGSTETTRIWLKN